MAEENPRVDTSNVTVSAFNSIRDQETTTKINLLGRDDKKYSTSSKFKVKVRAYTQTDKQSHAYFHSLSIDVNIDDFMGTAELKCPYDSDLMKYWTPISQDVIIYGSNKGPEKILFVGRVRGVKQDGYELVIEFQNYAWKFKQLVTQSYANDNVLNKDGYTIMRLMFEALKIDSYVISPAAKQRLKEVGINKDGNLTVNGKEVKKIPDLLERLKASDPSKLVNKNTINNKIKENKLGNIKDINYTLKYEKPTKIMQKIGSEGSYSSGKNIYEDAYASPSAQGGGVGGSKNKSKTNSRSGGNCYKLDVAKYCPGIHSSSISGCMVKISAYNRGCRDDIDDCRERIMRYASRYPNAYLRGTTQCLATLSKNITRTTGRNSCSIIKNDADMKAYASRSIQNISSGGKNLGANIHKASTGAAAGLAKGAGKFVGSAYGYLKGGANYVIGGFKKVFG